MKKLFRFLGKEKQNKKGAAEPPKEIQFYAIGSTLEEATAAVMEIADDVSFDNYTVDFGKFWN